MLCSQLLLECLAHPCSLALAPDGQTLYVAEMLRNRVLRLSQRPAGCYHASVFCQLAGAIGPIGLACDPRTVRTPRARSPPPPHPAPPTLYTSEDAHIPPPPTDRPPPPPPPQGTLYAAQHEIGASGRTGVVAVISAAGKVLRELAVPAAELTGLALSPDGAALVVTEASTNTVYRVPV